MFVFLVILTFLGTCTGDYDCACSYSVEKPVHSTSDVKGTLIGYMYEFDCKPVAKVPAKDAMWIQLAFEKQLGYIENDEQTEVVICPGNPSVLDALPSTSIPPAITTTQFSLRPQFTTVRPASNTTRLIQSSTVLSVSTHGSQTPKPIVTNTTLQSSATTLQQSSVTTSKPTNSTQPTTVSKPTTTAPKGTTPTTSSTTSTSPTTTSTIPSTTSTTPSITSTTPSITSTSTTSTTPSSTSTTPSSTSTTPSSTSTTTSTTSTTPSTTSTTSTTTPSTTSTTSSTTSTTPIPTTTVAATCPLGWRKFQNSCYLFHTDDRRSWVEASALCIRHGSHLVYIESKTENDYVVHQLKQRIHLSHHDERETSTWTGGADDIIEGIWMWYGQDTRITGYTNWYPNEPDQGEGDHEEDCMCIVGKKSWKWQDRECKLKMFLVCEKPVGYNGGYQLIG